MYSYYVKDCIKFHINFTPKKKKFISINCHSFDYHHTKKEKEKKDDVVLSMYTHI